MSPTAVCYWIINTRQNAVNEQWRCDPQKTRSGIKCILTLPGTFGYTEYFCYWNSPALCHAKIWPTDLLILALSVICMM